MFRDGNVISVMTTDGVSHEFKRPLKTSELIEKYQSKIRRIKLQIKFGRDNPGSYGHSMIEKNTHELHKLERIVEQLKAQPVQHKRLKHSYKKIKPDELKAMVMKKIEAAKQRGWLFINEGTLAYELNVKPHCIAQVMKELNAEGVVYQARHHIPHDSDRDPMCNGNYSGWLSDSYWFRHPDEDAND